MKLLMILFSIVLQWEAQAGGPIGPRLPRLEGPFLEMKRLAAGTAAHTEGRTIPILRQKIFETFSSEWRSELEDAIRQRQLDRSELDAANVEIGEHNVHHGLSYVLFRKNGDVLIFEPYDPHFPHWPARVKYYPKSHLEDNPENADVVITTGSGRTVSYLID